MSLIDVAKWRFLVNRDPEFMIAARYWNALLKVRMGEQGCILKIQDGQIAAVEETPTLFDAYDIEVAAPEEDWRKFLEPIPPPFYQDVFSAAIRHSFTVGADLESLFAYYPAARRMFELMRGARVED
jgi:hypothetical protein